MSKEQLNQRIYFYETRTEQERISVRARELNISISEYVRKCIETWEALQEKGLDR